MMNIYKYLLNSILIITLECLKTFSHLTLLTTVQIILINDFS